MDLRFLRRNGKVFTVATIMTLSSLYTVVEAEETGAEVDTIYEMQSIILSGRTDNYSGEDSQEYDDGSEYTGGYLEGKRSGMGSYIFRNDDTYVGEWDNDLMSGNGEYTFADGATLTGIFEKGELKDGFFTYSDLNGEYRVEVVNFEYSEEITATLANGDVYYGIYDNDTFSGDCKILYFSGDYYEGQVVENNKEGTGTYTWENGGVYIGEWKNDKMNGEGIYYFSSDVYPHLKGKFVDNKPSGSCEYYTDENVSITTTWENGEWVSQG